MRNRNPNGIEQLHDGRIIDKYGRRYELDLPYFERLVARGDQRAWYKALKNYGDPDRPPLKKRGPKPKPTSIITRELYLWDMKHPPFYYAEDLSDRPGAGFIISSDFPHHVGRVIVGKTMDKLTDYLVQRDIKQYYHCEGFPVVILPAGTLGGQQDPGEGHLHKDFIYRSMAKFYHDYKIKGKESYYRRYEKKG